MEPLTAIQPFEGNVTEDAKIWLTRFELYTASKGIKDAAAKATLPLFFKDKALKWYINLSQEVKGNYLELKAAFLKRYGPDNTMIWQRTTTLFQRKQLVNESAEDFVSDIIASGSDLNIPEEQIRHIIVSGLRPHIRQFVLQKQTETIDELRSAAKLAELTTIDTSTEQAQLRATISSLEQQVQAMSSLVTAALEKKPSDRCDTQQKDHKPIYQPYRYSHRNRCSFCGGEWHQNLKQCPAQGKECHRCHSLNHFAKMCRKTRREVPSK